MDEGSGGAPAGIPKSRLEDAVRDVKNRTADREDVLVELREAARARLELLAAELEPVFAEVPKEIEFFDFTISSGLKPRLWIDAVAHVGLDRDHRTFRFVRDTRAGRVTVAEGSGVAPIAEAVTDYVAERIVERERALETISSSAGPSAKTTPQAKAAPLPAQPAGSGFRSLLVLLLLGALFGLGLAAAVFWDRLPPLLPGLTGQ